VRGGELKCPVDHQRGQMFAQRAREVRRDEWEEPSGLRPIPHCNTNAHETRTLAIVTI